MKNFLFLCSLLFLSAWQLGAQEVVAEDEQYVQYQDSLFILQVTTIINQGLEGINDTSIQYLLPALDTAGLVDLLVTRNMNEVQQAGAVISRSYQSRNIFAKSAQTATTLEQLGVSLDSIVRSRTASRLVGRYRMITDTTNYIVEVRENPNNASFLQAREVGNLSNSMNIEVFGQWSFRLRVDGVWHYLNWDRSTPSENRVFRSWDFGTPWQIEQAPANSLRLRKLSQ